MIKKSLIQGLVVCSLIYFILIFFNIFEIELADKFIFSFNGMISFYIAVAVGVFMFMRI